jgi:hypothetical protein
VRKKNKGVRPIHPGMTTITHYTALVYPPWHFGQTPKTRGRPAFNAANVAWNYGTSDRPSYIPSRKKKGRPGIALSFLFIFIALILHPSYKYL